MDPRTQLLEYLKSRRLMSVATVGANGPWICNVYFAVSDSLDIYFLSHPQSRHATEIVRNKQVAITIADTNQEILGKKIGVQMQGTAEVIGQGDEHLKAMEHWLEASGAHNDPEILKVARVRFMVGTLFRFRPQMAKFLNEELFGDYGVKELVFESTS